MMDAGSAVDVDDPNPLMPASVMRYTNMVFVQPAAKSKQCEDG